MSVSVAWPFLACFVLWWAVTRREFSGNAEGRMTQALRSILIGAGGTVVIWIAWFWLSWRGL